MRVPFTDTFYTKDFDQEMLDFIKTKHRVWEFSEYPFTINTKNSLLRYAKDGTFFVTWSREGEQLTKQQFKEKIGMINKTSSTVDISTLKTGMIAELYYPHYNERSLVMVLLGTEDGDIVTGESWGSLEGKLKYIDKVYQPTTNVNYLSGPQMSFNKETGLNTKGCKLIWERKSPQQLEIDKLQAEVDERMQRINELKGKM